MPFLNPTSNLNAQLTAQGRNLLARAVLGLAAFTLDGFSVGRGGYVQADPTQAEAIIDTSLASIGTITLLDNNLATLTSVEINGVALAADVTSSSAVGTQWNKGIDLNTSTQNLTDAINADPVLHNLVLATVAGPVITLTARHLGSSGNTIQMTTTFFNHVSLNGNVGSSPENLAGGVDETQLDKIFPTTLSPTNSPSDIKPIDLIERPFPEVISAVCKLQLNEANFGLGEYALWVKVLVSNVASEVGKFLLYAKVHQPLVAKTMNNVHITRIITTY